MNNKTIFKTHLNHRVNNFFLKKENKMFKNEYKIILCIFKNTKVKQLKLHKVFIQIENHKMQNINKHFRNQKQ
jgi:hypothetical protein